jgi:hypothetical protein
MRTFYGLAASLLIAGPAAAQVQRYQSPAGEVEVVGLRRWTLAMLRDSIRHYVPGQDLHDAACMVTLRDSLHFAEASVMRFLMNVPGQPERNSLLVKVIEPQYASRVRWNKPPGDDFSSLLPDYAPYVLAMTDSSGGVWRGGMTYWLQFGDTATRAAALARSPARMRADGERLIAFLASHTADADRRRAVRTLQHDGFWVNRMIAAAVLSNFAASDSTILTLVHALRDPHEAVRGAAGVALHSAPSRAIDWTPVAADLRLLLGGTDLPQIEDLFELLTRTKVSPNLAAKLLRGNGDLLLDHLAVHSPMTADRAHALLVQLHGGTDLGRERRAWAQWIAAL